MFFSWSVYTIYPLDMIDLWTTNVQTFKRGKVEYLKEKTVNHGFCVTASASN